jgi:hypothetical protein
LEHNVRFEVASRYKRRLWTHMTATGAKLEAKWPTFRPGEGFQFLGTVGLFIIGARQLADVAPVVAKVIDFFDLKGFRFDFDAEVTALIENHLRGLEHRRDGAPRPAKLDSRSARNGRSRREVSR